MLESQDLRHLQYHDFLNLFPSHIRSDILNNSEIRSFKAGDAIFRCGDDGSWMGGIMVGRVRIVLRSSPDKEMFLSMFERNEIFGERSVLDKLPRGADAIAEDDTVIFIMPRDKMLPLLFQYPESMFYLVQVLCNRLLRYTESMQLHATQNLPVRLASYLLFLARTYGAPSGEHIVIRSGLNQSDIGQKLATTRESVNRQLKLFAKAGIIALDKTEITLLEPQKLEDICAALHKI